jgi:hypothetical protein
MMLPEAPNLDDSLDDWRAYLAALHELPFRDDVVRDAIAFADRHVRRRSRIAEDPQRG